jgi:hypothetical protein
MLNGRPGFATGLEIVALLIAGPFGPGENGAGRGRTLPAASPQSSNT